MIVLRSKNINMLEHQAFKGIAVTVFKPVYLAQFSGKWHGDSLDFCVSFEPVLSEFTAGAALLVPAEGSCGAKDVITVQPEKYKWELLS